eukprot:2477240-Amphidinium_carterae.1
MGGFGVSQTYEAIVELVAALTFAALMTPEELTPFLPVHLSEATTPAFVPKNQNLLEKLTEGQTNMKV